MRRPGRAPGEPPVGLVVLEAGELAAVAALVAAFGRAAEMLAAEGTACMAAVMTAGRIVAVASGMIAVGRIEVPAGRVALAVAGRIAGLPAGRIAAGVLAGRPAEVPAGRIAGMPAVGMLVEMPVGMIAAVPVGTTAEVPAGMIADGYLADRPAVEQPLEPAGVHADRRTRWPARAAGRLAAASRGGPAGRHVALVALGHRLARCPELGPWPAGYDPA